MALSFCSFSSGSSGNCYLIKSETTALLVDAGISLKRIREGLSMTETNEEQVQAVLITHEHADHIKSLGALCGSRGLARSGEPLAMYATYGTWAAMEQQPVSAAFQLSDKRIVRRGETFFVGDIQVRSFSLSHDAAEAVGYAFVQRGHGEQNQLAIVTDTGIVTTEILEQIRNVQMLVLEANHDVNMLKIGRYPWFLKQRILSDVGHLSNDAAADVAVQLLSEGTAPRQIALAHLSAENNFPEMAWQTMKNALEEADYVFGKDLNVCTLIRDTISQIFILE